MRKVGVEEEKREGEGSCMCGHHLLNWLLDALQYAGPYGHFLYYSYGTSICVCVCVCVCVIWKLIDEPKKILLCCFH